MSQGQGSAGHPARVRWNSAYDNTQLGSYGGIPYPSRSYNPFCHKTRHKTTKDQLQVLELSYVNNRKPDAKEREMLARRIDMTPRGVQIWFQNRRAKEKSIALKGKAGEKTLVQRPVTDTKPPTDATENFQFGDPTSHTDYTSLEAPPAWPSHIHGEQQNTDVLLTTSSDYDARAAPSAFDAFASFQPSQDFQSRPFSRSRAMSLPSIHHNQPFPQDSFESCPCCPGDGSIQDTNWLIKPDPEAGPGITGFDAGPETLSEIPAPSDSGLIPFDFYDTSVASRPGGMVGAGAYMVQPQNPDPAITQFPFIGVSSGAHFRRGSCPPDFLASMGAMGFQELRSRVCSSNQLQSIEETIPWEDPLRSDSMGGTNFQ